MISCEFALGKESRLLLPSSGLEERTPERHDQLHAFGSWGLFADNSNFCQFSIVSQYSRVIENIDSDTKYVFTGRL